MPCDSNGVSAAPQNCDFRKVKRGSWIHYTLPRKSSKSEKSDKKDKKEKDSKYSHSRFSSQVGDLDLDQMDLNEDVEINLPAKL